MGRIGICGQLLWHRHRMVQALTRVMNQLQVVALNPGLRRKKGLWREAGGKQLESFALAPWVSRRPRDLLEWLDRLNPTIAELTQGAIWLPEPIRSPYDQHEGQRSQRAHSGMSG